MQDYPLCTKNCCKRLVAEFDIVLCFPPFAPFNIFFQNLSNNLLIICTIVLQFAPIALIASILMYFAQMLNP